VVSTSRLDHSSNGDRAVAPLLAERLDEDLVDPAEVALGVDAADLDARGRLARFAWRSIEVELQVVGTTERVRTRGTRPTRLPPRRRR
jgi:hypothetical protein